ncbi:MAG TPA: cytochrome b/b6 domain-containing protein [Actinomycetes bacterium]|jgi:formate dehydrogenase subunit gamma|nr:cytochrome b/b6 domain-containing protein [Actinomycetes bacterium]
MSDRPHAPDPAAGRLPRNGRRARWLHALVYSTTVFLAYSGIAVLAEGHPGLASVLGGHVPAATSHRWVGYAVLAVAVLVVVVWWRAAGRFLIDSVRFRRSDLRWLAGYPRMALAPRRPAPAPHHDGHFDPGQRIFNVLLVLALIVLGATGVILGMPGRFIPAVFGWSLRIHELTTWILCGLLLGHLLLSSGVLPGYRGVWRAMHRDGRVPAATARRLWPQWAGEPRAPERAGTGGHGPRASSSGAGQGP